MDLLIPPNIIRRTKSHEISESESQQPAASFFGEVWPAVQEMINGDLSSNSSLPQTCTSKNVITSNQEFSNLHSIEVTPVPSPPQNFGGSDQDPIETSGSNVNELDNLGEEATLVLAELLNCGLETNIITTTQMQYSPIPSPISIASGESIINISDCESIPCNNVNKKRKVLSKPKLGKKRKRCEENWVDNNGKILRNSGQDNVITISDCESIPHTNVNKKRKVLSKPKAGNKKKRCEENWIDNKRKMLLNSGQEYVTRKGKLKDQKQLHPICPTTCKLKCYEKFDNITRQNIFEQFWKLSDHAKQWEFINEFTIKNKKKSVTIEGPSRRNFTTKYFLPLPSNTRQHHSTYEPTQVCLRTFLNTLCITDQIVRTAHSKLDQEGVTLPDNRGKHPNHPVVQTAEMIRSVCDHIACFQPVVSKYARKGTDVIYLDNNLSMSKMFSLYKEWDQLQNYDSQALTIRQYMDIANKNMKISFSHPNKNVCKKCYSVNGILTEESFQHIENIKIDKEFKQNSKRLAENGSKVVCASLGFQGKLNCPRADIGLLYYKHNLSVYNFTVFDVAKEEAFCYMWTECTGNRGANEEASCLESYIKTQINKGATTFMFWSDSCSDQNRNRVLISMYMYLSHTFNVDITHRFFESGHTESECENVHAVIEKEAKGKTIYTPDQWYALVRWAKTPGKPYNVVEVTQQEIFDFNSLLNSQNWRTDTDNGKILWNEIKEICIDKKVPNCVFFKYYLKGEMHSINISTRNKRRGQRINNNSELKLAYTARLAISDAKYKDLISLCNSGVIPKEYHRFYKNIRRGSNGKKYLNKSA